MRFPLRVERYELRPEAPGAGEWRGGIGAGATCAFSSTASCHATATARSKRRRAFSAGGDGLPAQIVKNPAVPTSRCCRRNPPAASSSRATSSAWSGQTPAVYGRAAPQRGRARGSYCRRFCTPALISVEAAREVYRVVLDPATGAIDRAATDPTASDMSCESLIRASLTRIDARRTRGRAPGLMSTATRARTRACARQR